MNQPHKCPICEGKGEITKKLAQVGSVVVCKKPLLFRCHGCQGAGLIWDQQILITPQPFQPFTPNGPTWIDPNSNGYTLNNANQQLGVSIGDGVTKCVCGEPHYMAPAPNCKDHTRDGGCSV